MIPDTYIEERAVDYGGVPILAGPKIDAHGTTFALNLSEAFVDARTEAAKNGFLINAAIHQPV